MPLFDAGSFDAADSVRVSSASNSFESSFASSAVTLEGSAASSSPSCNPPAGPGVGFRPSRNAFAMSVAFHFAYLIRSRFCGACYN